MRPQSRTAVRKMDARQKLALLALPLLGGLLIAAVRLVSALF